MFWLSVYFCIVLYLYRSTCLHYRFLYRDAHYAYGHVRLGIHIEDAFISMCVFVEPGEMYHSKVCTIAFVQHFKHIA